MDAEVWRSTIRTRIGQRWEDVWNTLPRALDPTDNEAVHDVRVASRRLRAAMDVAESTFPSSWYAPLHRLAETLTSELGTVRDLEVILEYFVQVRNEAPPNEHPGLDRMIARVEHKHSAARAEMEVFLRDLSDRNIRAETSQRFPVEATKGARK